MATLKENFTDIQSYSNTDVLTETEEDSPVRRIERRSVILYNTEIFRVDWTEGTLRLNTGGHFTQTTKRRMNEALRASGMTYRVRQVDSEWYVYDTSTGERVAHFDGSPLVKIIL